MAEPASKAAPVQIRRAYHDGRFGQVHYRIAGPRESTCLPLLCLHQTPNSGLEWEPLIRELAQDRIVVAPDNPGYGMSDPPPVPVGIPDFAAEAAAVMTALAKADAIPTGSFDVIGYHTGSLVATELALGDPRPRRIVLISLAAYDEAERARRLATLYEKFPPPDGTLNHIEKLWAIIGQLGDHRVAMADRHVAMAENLRLGARMPWAYESVYRYDFLGGLARLDRPVLVVNPADDLEDVTRRTAPTIPGARLLELPGRAHGFMAFESAGFAATLREFLDAA